MRQLLITQYTVAIITGILTHAREAGFPENPLCFLLIHTSAIELGKNVLWGGFKLNSFCEFKKTIRYADASRFPKNTKFKVNEDDTKQFCPYYVEERIKGCFCLDDSIQIQTKNRSFCYSRFDIVS